VAWFQHLRRTAPTGAPLFLSLCPGAVRSNIAGDANAVLRAIVRLVMLLAFKSPAKVSQACIVMSARKEKPLSPGHPSHPYSCWNSGVALPPSDASPQHAASCAVACALASATLHCLSVWLYFLSFEQASP